MLPAIALLAGASTTLRPKNLSSTLVLWIATGAVLFSLLQQSRFLFLMTPLEISRQTYGTNPFPEAVEIAAYIKAHSRDSDRIAVLGSEPEIYLYASRQSVTPYVYFYPLMEPRPYALQMQEEFIRDVESANPEYLVMVNAASSWLRQPSSYNRLLDWLPGYISAHYTPVGLADALPGRSVYKWDSDVTRYRPVSPENLVIFKRRSM
jgi:hypothetical protein